MNCVLDNIINVIQDATKSNPLKFGAVFTATA